LAHDPRISRIFYHFEAHTDIRNGRTVGRKIGVIQEIIIKKFLLTDQKVRDCLIYEPRIRGRSGATHKVEFVLFAPLVVAEIAAGRSLRIHEPSLEVSVLKVDAAAERARVAVLTGEGKTTKLLAVEQALAITLVWLGQPTIFYVKLSGIDGGTCRISILKGAVPLASLESKRVGAQRFAGTEALGSGIQTIEKAKQTALVAVDFDLQFNAQILALTTVDAERRFRSFAVLGNGVHWTDHDLSVLQTYVDYTFQVKDDAVIRYSEFIDELCKGGEQPFFEFFMAYFNGMTNTPPDAFVVTRDDFILMRPTDTRHANATLTELVRMQLPDYPVARSV
jgi:hypothetical protein